MRHIFSNVIKLRMCFKNREHSSFRARLMLCLGPVSEEIRSGDAFINRLLTLDQVSPDLGLTVSTVSQKARLIPDQYVALRVALVKRAQLTGCCRALEGPVCLCFSPDRCVI